MGLEVSRLARNDADWQRLLELCALYGCLVGDDDGVIAVGADLYDCSQLPALGHGSVPGVYNSLEFERLLARNGPSGGDLQPKERFVGFFERRPDFCGEFGFGSAAARGFVPTCSDLDRTRNSSVYSTIARTSNSLALIRN